MWGVFLVGISSAVAHRVLASLGVGLITYAGFTVIKGQIDSAVDGALGSMQASVYQILALAGVVDAAGIWLGAISALIALMSFKRLGILSNG